MSDGHLRRRRRGGGDDRLRPQPARGVGEAEVVGAEVVPPLGDAVRLVDDEQADVRPPQALEEPGRGEALRRDVEQPHVARHRLLDRAAVGRGVALRVDERDAARRHALERLDLVLHQRHQRRDHERQVGPHQRRQLVAERLARARRHHHEHVAVRERGADRLRLAAAEGRGSRTARAARPRGPSRARRAPAGAARGRAGRGSRRLPWAAGHYPQPRRAPGASCGALRRPVAELAHSGARRLPRGAHPRGSRTCSATSCSASTPAAPTRSAPTSRAAATSTSPRSSPARSRRAAKQAIVERVAPRGAAVPRPRARARRLPARHRALGRRRARLRAQPQHRRGDGASASTRSPARSRASGSRSTARSCASTACALTGPPAAELFAPIPRATLLPLLAESVRWHRDSDVPLGSDVVLNTCRALRFAAEGTWSSKREAGAWAAGEPIVRAALAGERARPRRGGAIPRRRPP